MNQFNEIKSFIDSAKIPNNEMVLIAGDLNVIRDSSEYYDMLSKLNVNKPKYSGVPFTWDTKTNEITAFYLRERAARIFGLRTRFKITLSASGLAKFGLRSDLRKNMDRGRIYE
ncbi:sphingomyelinase C family protein [Leptospira santarosai serovar Shermani str. 1342KT]|nr:sphingomyelinase C family protein [Leptospira santarosai serovar Shermani str. 1342KT]